MYTKLEDSYISVMKALYHAGMHCKARVIIKVSVYQARRLLLLLLFATRERVKWLSPANFKWPYLKNDMDDFYILQVFIWATFHHSDPISWKSEGGTFLKLVDLTWNDPFSYENTALSVLSSILQVFHFPISTAHKIHKMKYRGKWSGFTVHWPPPFQICFHDMLYPVLLWL